MACAATLGCRSEERSAHVADDSAVCAPALGDKGVASYRAKLADLEAGLDPGRADAACGIS
jgi:hypothetical protein